MPYPIKHQISVTKLSKILGFSLTHTYNLMNGRKVVVWETAEKLASLTGISASWWMRATRKEVSKTLDDPKTWRWVPHKIERR